MNINAPNSALLLILKQMMKIRAVEEEIASVYHRGEMRCPTHLSIGQEAVPSVLASFLDDTDLAVSTHRGHAHYISKGGSLPKMIAELYGKSTGCAKGKGGSMHLVDKAVGFMGTSAIVGNSIPIGVGLALGLKLENTKDIAVVFLGDGATEEGVFYESLNFAAVRNLPVLFVCENNAYSVYSPLSCRQPKERKIFKVAESLGVNSFEMDGNDVIPMLEKIGQAVHSVRKMGCPVLIECHTYRWREHCGPNFDDDLNYRDKLEVQNWRAKDPIKKLISELDLTEVEVKKIREQIDIEVKNAFDYAKASPFPDASEAYKDEFAQR